jgi:hypothetical protein
MSVVIIEQAKADLEVLEKIYQDCPDFPDDGYYSYYSLKTKIGYLIAELKSDLISYRKKPDLYYEEEFDGYVYFETMKDYNEWLSRKNEISEYKEKFDKLKSEQEAEIEELKDKIQEMKAPHRVEIRRLKKEIADMEEGILPE